ncbi:bifunctional DNA primase/polymerase [Streptomyces sp. TRM76323]|uniref:Bifunctional DNA primase/polymerase n=1 Tax=Streptomyces tamarix TaxID=3078565 RepID=A0ABU3QUF6_9ACTN|nr:bifunctional DNA primase/polymerase [Streptomyces tamarix]MDT9686416.1 bifunctional DNA primase/polymerase [Streptomyces tamarix]
MSTLTDFEAALRAASRGLALFHLPAGGRVPAPGWHEEATTDPAALVQLLADGANVGVGCRASRVVALDLDVHQADGPALNRPRGTAVQRLSVRTIMVRA